MSSITPINNVDGLGKIAKLAKSTNIIGEVSSFSSILDDALKQNKSTQVLTTNPIVPQSIPGLSTLQGDDMLIAQAFPEASTEAINPDARRDQNSSQLLSTEELDELGGGYRKLAVSPFQIFLDRGIDALESVSEMEFRVNDLIDKFMQGQATIDEVSIETSKLNLAVSFATTVITTATTTFKELTQMQI